MKKVIRHVPFIALAVAALGWFAPAYDGFLTDWHDPTQHMEFVWVVPVLCGVLLWLRRQRIAESLGAPEPWVALPFFVVAGGLLFLGMRGGQSRFSEAAAVVLLAGLVLACYGRQTLRETWFPILLLVFVMPVGFLDNFTVPLRRMSVTVTAVLLNGLGVGVRQVGTAIVATSEPAFHLDVADPCSGIRSLVALFVGTAAYGAIALRSVWRRWLLFLASVPIAFLGNILRLTVTALACHWVSQSAGMVLHDNALFFVSPIYALLVFALADFLKRGDRVQAEEKASAGGEVAWRWRTVLGLAVLLVGMPIFRFYASKQPPLVFESDAFLSPAFQSLPGTEMQFPWFCQNRLCLWSGDFDSEAQAPTQCPQCGGEVRRVSKAELDILPRDTQSRKVTYRLPNGDTFTAALVIAGRNRMSIHRPELCLPAQGFVMSERKVVEVLPGVPMACFSLSRTGQTARSGFAYVFLHASGATVSNLERVVGDSVERSLHNRIRRWAMVTISSPQHDFQTPEGREALRRFMETFYPTLWRVKPHA